MFGKLAADALGLSDIGKILTPAEFVHADVDDYILHEEQEKIFFVIKSKKDEYCFTNSAFLHLDGKSAVSSKRTLYRYDYAYHPISNVYLETAGTVDLDVEIKFTLGDKAYSIDIDKKQLELLKDLYKALIKIAQLTAMGEHNIATAQKSLQCAVDVLSGFRGNSASLIEDYQAINEYSFKFMQETYRQNTHFDYAKVFETYLHN